MAWLAPLALALVFLWLFRADPCLDDEIGNHLRAMNAPVATAVQESTSGPIRVVIDNPHGIEACDYWPDTRDHVIALGSLAVIVVFLGFLSAWCFRERARMRAALITFVLLWLAFAFQLLVYMPDFRSELDVSGYSQLVRPILLVCGLIVGVAMVSSLAAHLTLKFRPRE